MSFVTEPLLRDLLWSSLDERQDIVDVGSEVNVGSGRIDVVAKTDEDKYIGYEIKDAELIGDHSSVHSANDTVNQVNEYAESGYLDEVYLVSNEVEDYKKALSRETLFARPHGGSHGAIYKSLRRGVINGSYSAEEIENKLRESLPEEAEDFIDKTIERVNKDAEPPETYDERSIDNVVDELLSDWTAVVGTGIGLIEIPLDIHQVSHKYGDGTSQFLYTSLDKLHPGPEISVNKIQNAKPLNRDRTPHLSKINEAWITHNIVDKMGGFREAVIVGGRKRKRVDVVEFRNARSPTEVYTKQPDSKLVGYEAKSEFSPTDADIRRQLGTYLYSGCLTHLYLAVPSFELDAARKIIDQGTDNYDLSPVGIVSVDEDGDITRDKNATPVTMKYDSYATKLRKRPIVFGGLEPIHGNKEVVKFSDRHDLELVQREPYTNAGELEGTLLYKKDGFKSTNHRLDYVKQGFDQELYERVDKHTPELPYGFEIDDSGFVHVDPEQFTEARELIIYAKRMERSINRERDISDISSTFGLPESTIHEIFENSNIYCNLDSNDDPIQTAIERELGYMTDQIIIEPHLPDSLPKYLEDGLPKLDPYELKYLDSFVTELIEFKQNDDIQSEPEVPNRKPKRVWEGISKQDVNTLQDILEYSKNRSEYNEEHY